MDLEFHDVCELLNVPEQTLQRLIVERKIPTYFLHQRPLFNRQEIEAWVMMNQELFNTLKGHVKGQANEEEVAVKRTSRRGQAHFHLFRALTRGMVYDDVEGDTKAAVIQETLKRMAPPLKLDPEVLTELFMERERLVPTALGHGFAIPHARDFLMHGHRDVVTVIFLSRPIAYGALDGKPVHTLFFLLAADDKRHLSLLSRIAHLIGDPEMQTALACRPSKAPLLEFIKEWEASLACR